MLSTELASKAVTDLAESATGLHDGSVPVRDVVRCASLRGSRSRWWQWASIVVLTGFGVVAAPGVADAAGTAQGSWTVAGANPSWTGTLSIAATGFPSAVFATNSNSPSTPSASFLNAATPYGSAFGSTQGSAYLSAAAAAGQAPSTTTITFASPTPPAGWGFAFGDIDADQIQIAATGPGGTLTAGELGFQGVFNYCTATTPRPAACGGAAQTDLPTWNPGTSTLVGNVVDTTGASGWFRPTTPITSITLTFSVLSGIPSFQMWASAITSNISGTVTLDGTSDPAPAGTTMQLLDADGAEVATTTTSGTATYSFVDVIATDYTVVVVAPAGYEVRGADELTAAASSGDVTDVDFLLAQIPPPTTTPQTTTPQTTTPSTTVPTTTTQGGAIAPPTTLSSTTTVGPSGQLPATGTHSSTILLVGILAATTGLALIGTARRSGSSSRREI